MEKNYLQTDHRQLSEWYIACLYQQQPDLMATIRKS